MNNLKLFFDRYNYKIKKWHINIPDIYGMLYILPILDA